MDPAAVNLYLVGFMGTGKTTVGRAAAQRLGFGYCDSDREIEERCGRTVAEIFAREGEPFFRQREREFVESGHPRERTVVACGGGLVVPPGMAEALRVRGVVVCLHATVATILERTARQEDRPLLAGGDREGRVRALLAEREPAYRRSGTVILTDGRTVREVVDHVLRVWRREARAFAAAQAGS